jgi:hypothetical protein
LCEFPRDRASLAAFEGSGAGLGVGVSGAFSGASLMGSFGGRRSLENRKPVESLQAAADYGPVREKFSRPALFPRRRR